MTEEGARASGRPRAGRALRDGHRAQGTRPLARALDEIRPEPRLVPDDPRVEEAERWGDDVLQQWARRGTRSRRQMSRLVKLAYRMTPEQLRDDQGGRRDPRRAVAPR